MPRTQLACRPHSYHPFEAIAYEHMASLGIRHVEIEVPAPQDLMSVAATLDRHGLRASSLQGTCDLSRPDVGRQIDSQMPAFAALDCRLMFLSVKAGTTPPEIAFVRLREGGEAAGAHGVTIILETHPDLVTNAAVATTTLRSVDHPQVRINYDTANIYFYNEGVDAATELRAILPWVAAVHLKDTDGGFRHWHFPALGRGVVPFGEVFALLDHAGFAGPCTLEIEGLEGESPSERLVCDRIAESIGFLRGLGRRLDN